MAAHAAGACFLELAASFQKTIRIAKNEKTADLIWRASPRGLDMCQLKNTAVFRGPECYFVCRSALTGLPYHYCQTEVF